MPKKSNNNNEIFVESNANNENNINQPLTDSEIEDAKKILRAIETLIDSNDKIIAVYNKAYNNIKNNEDKDEPLSEKELFNAIGKKIISHYTNKATISGGVSGLPSVIPGIGSLIGFLGASLADSVLTLKFEVEMALCLSHLAGFNLDNQRDRQLAFTLASVTSYELRKSDNKLIDSTALAASAFWDYSMRQLSKYLLISIAKRTMLISIRKSLLFVPILGLAISAGMNQILTKRTGIFTLETLWDRRIINASDEVMDAEFIEIKENNNE